jgi:Spy/CpxP family protein refolding chaperone
VSQRIADARERIDELLQPEQRAKFREISFQTAGGLDALFLNEQMLEAVDITADQKAAVRQIVIERDAEADAARSKIDFDNFTWEDYEAYKAANTERAKRYAEQMKAVLTAEQWTKAEKLTAGVAQLRESLWTKKASPWGEIIEEEQNEQEPDVVQRSPRPPVYIPGPDSWKPGDPLPAQPRAERRTGRFPRGDDRP